MATTYIDRFLPQLVSYDWAQTLVNTTTGQDLMHLLANFLIDESYRTWNNQYPLGVWPEALVEEMRGLVAGCQHADPASPVTFQRIVTINYGFDWVSSLAFSGGLAGRLSFVCGGKIPFSLPHLHVLHSSQARVVRREYLGSSATAGGTYAFLEWLADGNTRPFCSPHGASAAAQTH